MRTNVQQNSSRQSSKDFTLSNETKSNILKLVNLLAITGTFVFFIYLSLTNDNLFLKEISVGGGILLMLGLVRILSKN